MKKVITLFLILCSFSGFATGVDDNQPVFSENSGECDLHAGKADSYVLALSSQAGFCKTYGYEAGKPECSRLKSDSYEANHLTLHGLWPNQRACGLHYGYCGAKQLSSHCDYKPVALSDAISDDLKRVMPSYREGSCLERHEWNKHGTCQSLVTDAYFSLAIRFLDELDESDLGRYVTEHKGQKVKLSALREQVRQAFGVENAGKVYFGCSKGLLVDVYVSLPNQLTPNESLSQLMSRAPDYPQQDSCPSSLSISDFTPGEKQAWV